MKTRKNRIIRKGLIPVVAVITVLFPCIARAQDKSKNPDQNPPKHYFNTTFILDGYEKPSVDIDTSGIGKRLKSYGVKQSNFSFYIPLFVTS